MLEILFPLAGTRADDVAADHALRVAKLLNANVHLVRVLESRRTSDRPTDPVDWQIKKGEAENSLTRVAEKLSRAGVESEQVLLEGDPTEHLVNYARQKNADLVLLTGGPRHGALGISGGELLWRSFLTTLLVRPYQELSESPQAAYPRILVALDGSKRAECVLPWVQMLAAAGEGKGVEVVLAHVVMEPELPRLTPPSEEDTELARRLVERNREEAAAYLEGARARLGVRAETRLLQGRKASTVLLDMVEAEGMDLVVLSAHGYGGESPWPFGDVATSFIERGRTPLLLVQDMLKGQFDPAGVTSESWGG